MAPEVVSHDVAGHLSAIAGRMEELAETQRLMRNAVLALCFGGIVAVGAGTYVVRSYRARVDSMLERQAQR